MTKRTPEEAALIHRTIEKLINRCDEFWIVGNTRFECEADKGHERPCYAHYLRDNGDIDAVHWNNDWSDYEP